MPEITIKSVEKAVQERWVPSFRFEEYESTPFVRLNKKISESKGALITTGGVFVKGQAPFSDNFGLGDPSYREIPSDTPVKQLSRYHEHYDHTNAIKDVNCIFPIERIRELQSNGEVGELSETFYSFMGYVPITHPLKTVTAPQVAKKLVKDHVDFAVLVPV